MKPEVPGPLVIRTAWNVIDCCPFSDPEDKTCSNPSNPTPECHSSICPFARPQTPDVRIGVR